MNLIYTIFYDFWNELFFEMPTIGSNFIHSLTMLSIFTMLGFILMFIYKVPKMFFRGPRW